MSKYNKVKNEGVETFRKRFSGMNLLHEHFIMPLKYPRIEEYLSTFAEKVHKATLEDVYEKLDKNYLGYCREHNGLPYCKNCGLDLEELKTLTK